MIKILLLSSTIILTIQCQSNANSSTIENSQTEINIPEVIIENKEEQPVLIDSIFDRSIIKASLQSKIAQKEPLVVHVYIPLCDNINQGIVPTTKSLGDGLSLRTNLYWATSGGTKGYFKNQKEWKMVYNAFDIDTNVLERIVFKKQFKNSVVYMVADAYRGDRMEETINDYLASISNNRHAVIEINDSSKIEIAGYSDLIMFNGHNGVMDNIDIKPWVNTSDKRTDIVMNACVSYGYLQEEFMQAGGYPLVRTNSLLYPGAYVLNQIIDDWVNGTEEVQLCLNAGRAYCLKHDCGRGTKVYKSGW